MFARVVGGAWRRAVRRGVWRGSNFWLAVGTASFCLRLLRRFTRARPEIAREELLPGQTLVISHLPKPS
jgi:hypothetical protein